MSDTAPGVSETSTSNSEETPEHSVLPEDPVLSKSIVELQAALQGKSHPRDFSRESLVALLERQAEYVEEVGLEAIRIAKSSQADFVSKRDIEKADEVVRSASGANGVGAFTEPVGGIILGAGLGQLLSVLAAEDPEALSYALATAACIIGVALLVYGITRRMS